MSSWWNEGVPVRLSPKLTFNVTSSERAARLLLNDWPGDPNTAKHIAARKAVLRALEAMGDQKRALAARKAFEAAVIEAGAHGSPPHKPAAAPGKTRPRKHG